MRVEGAATSAHAFNRLRDIAVLSTPLIQLALHAQEPGLVGLMIRVHGSFLRLRLPIDSLLAFAMWPAFPTSDYYASSAPLTPIPVRRG